MSILQLYPDLLYPPHVYRAVGRATILCKADEGGADFIAHLNAANILPFKMATDPSQGDIDASQAFVRHIDDVMNDMKSRGAVLFFNGCQEVLDELGITMEELESHNNDKNT